MHEHVEKDDQATAVGYALARTHIEDFGRHPCYCHSLIDWQLMMMNLDDAMAVANLVSTGIRTLENRLRQGLSG